MRFKGTAILFILFLGIGAWVYFSEIRGREAREQQEEAKKKVFQVEQKEINEISLIYPDRTITGVKKGDKKWEITSPAGIEADPDEWDMLASNVPKIEHQDVVAENAQDLTPFGLKDPAVRIVAKASGGKTFDVLFGSENPKKTLNYAKVGNSNEVFMTPSSWAHSFTKTVNDLRNKKVLEFESDDVDAVTVAAPGSDLQLQKMGEDWRIKKPIDTKADGTEITAFVNSIRFARASSFADPAMDAKSAGLDPAAIGITLHDGKAKGDRVLLVGKTAETDKYYAKDPSRNTIFIIEKEIPDKARRPVFDWRDKSITRIDREKTQEIEIQRGTEKSSLKKVDADWKLTDGRKLQWDKVSAMLSALEFDKTKDIIDSPKAASTYGLDKPKVEVIFKQGSNELLRLAFGTDSKTPEGIYLKTSDNPAVKVVGKDVFDKFNVKAEDLVDTTPAPPAEKPKS